MSARNFVLVLLVCLAWSFNFTAGAAGMEHFSPGLFMILRFVLLLAVLFPFVRWPPPGQLPRLAVVCLLIGCFHFVLMFWALQRSADVSSVAILQQTYIPMAVILAILLLGEKIGWISALAIVFAFAGVMLIGFDPLVFSQPDALALALLSAFLQALGSVYMRNIRGVGVLNFQAWTCIFSLPVLLLITLLFEQDQPAMIRSAGLVDWSSVAYSALVASLLGHGLFYRLIQELPVTRVMPWMLMTPVFAMAWGVLVWGDQPGWRLLAGAVMVLAGVLVINLRALARWRVQSLAP